MTTRIDTPSRDDRAVCGAARQHAVTHGRLRQWRSVALVLLSAAMPHAWAQTPALTPATSQGVGKPGAAPALTVPATPASAASTPRPGRRYLSSDEKRESATSPGELRPTDPVVPQIRIPIGRNANSANDGASAAAGSIDEDAARCRAQADPAARARCGAGTQKLMPKPSLRP